MHYRGAMRSPFPRMAAPACAILVLAATACRSTPEVEPPDAAIVGTWRAADGSLEIDFSSSGLYAMRLKDRERPVMGSFSYDAKEATLALATRRESPVCGDDNGSYRVIVGGISMDLEAVRDTCEVRAKALATRLERVGAKR